MAKISELAQGFSDGCSIHGSKRHQHQTQGVDFGFCQSDIICENLWNLWETSELGGDIETGTGFFHAGHVTVSNYFGVWICDAQLLDEGVHGAPLF